MMYLHYCRNCQKIHMLNGHKITCPRCQHSLLELKMPYMDYVRLDPEQRIIFLESCRNSQVLQNLCTTYRMYKYSKWYKDYLETERTGQPPQISAYISCDFRMAHEKQETGCL